MLNDRSYTLGNFSSSRDQLQLEPVKGFRKGKGVRQLVFFRPVGGEDASNRAI